MGVYPGMRNFAKLKVLRHLKATYTFIIRINLELGLGCATRFSDLMLKVVVLEISKDPPRWRLVRCFKRSKLYNTL
jgi:hypothetical protein